MSKISAPAPPEKTPDKFRPLLSNDVTGEYLNAAAPGQGTVTYDEGYNRERHKAEVSFSKWLLATFGGDIKLLNEVNAQMINTNLQ